MKDISKPIGRDSWTSRDYGVVCRHPGCQLSRDAAIQMILPGVLALVGRSIRVESRSWQTHLIRGTLTASIYASICVLMVNAAWFGAPGLRFFYGIAYLNLLFLSLMGISVFSTTISEEKEEDTLGLMLMAGISPLGILIGKSGSRLIETLILIAVQYPFTLLAVTMGGVTQLQVSAAYCGLSAYMFFLAGVGLLCSTICSSNRKAGAWMIFIISIYVILPWTAAELQSRLIKASIQLPGITDFLNVVAGISIFQQMGMILTSGYSDDRLTWQVISNVGIGAISFLAAWGLFGVGSRQPSTEPLSRGMVTRIRGRLPFLSPGRVWRQPFLWKDFYFVSGGIGMMPVRLLFCGALLLVSMLPSHSVLFDISFYQVFLSLALVIEAGRMMACSVNDEIRGRTLAALMMLPRSNLQIIYSKYAGALLGLWPALLVEAATLMTAEGCRNFCWVAGEPLGFCVATFFLLIPNLAALLATYVRWGAVTLSVALVIAMHFGMMMSIQPVSAGDSTGLLTGLAVLACCFACHIGIASRIKTLSAST